MRKKILIVDDDQRMVSAIKRILVFEDKYDLEVVYNGAEVETKFLDFKPDLLVLDVMMPGFNGYKVCTRIRQDPANSEVKILIVSGIIGKEDNEKIKLLGANDYLPKPFTAQTLVSKVENLLG